MYFYWCLEIPQRIPVKSILLGVFLSTDSSPKKTTNFIIILSEVVRQSSQLVYAPIINKTTNNNLPVQSILVILNSMLW